MEHALCWLGLALGGEAGARTAQRLGLVVSGDTLLRQLRRGFVAQKPIPIAPRVLGMDDWAWRKGQRYGTILCDLERRRVVDLLPDRQSRTVTAWLRDHAPPEVIARDRAGAYAEAARRGAPDAIQVADRFHLLRNLREALEHVLTRHTAVIEESLRQSRSASVSSSAHSSRFDLDPSSTTQPRATTETIRALPASSRVASARHLQTSHRAATRTEPQDSASLAACRTVSRTPSPATALLGGPLALLPGEALGRGMPQSQSALAGTASPRGELCRRHLAPLVSSAAGSARTSFSDFALAAPETSQSATHQRAAARPRS